MEAVKKKILVVEDDKYVINLISNALSTLSLDYFLACNGKDALEILERYPDQVSLIILDWIMPLMGGIEFANIIRNDKRFKDIPIIMQTSKKDQSDLKQAYDIDIQHYLIKPYTAKVLLSAVKQSLREIRKKDYIVMEAKSMVDSVISYTKSKLLSTLKKVDLDLKSYREINRFYLESLSCTNLEELTELILSCVTAFEFESSIDAGYDDLGKKLRCSIKLSSQEVVNLSDRGIKSSLDEMILSKTLDKGEVLEQSTYTAIPSNNKKVAILIRNTPGDEKEKKIALKIVTSLIEQFEMRLEHFENQSEIRKKSSQLEGIIKACAEELDAVNNNYQDMKERQMDLIEGLAACVIPRIPDLDEKQAEKIAQILGEQVIKSMELFSEDQITDQKFNITIKKLQNAIKNKAKEDSNRLEPGKMAGTSQNEIDDLLSSFGM